MIEKPQQGVFYDRGLRFSCTRCSDCCRHEPGFVFLSRADLSVLEEELKMEYTALQKTYCRWVPAFNGVEQLALKEKANFDCIFWKEGCTVYKSRPLQCRTFPFWKSTLFSKEAWKQLSCPGIGKGELYTRDDIESVLAQQRAAPVVTRRA